MLGDPFESPKALLTWAYEDLEEFRVVEDEFFAADPYERIVEFDEEWGRNAHRVRYIGGDLPPRLRKLASHIVNDLRHALDQATVTAAKRFGWQPSKKCRVLYYPWADSKANLEGNLWKFPKELHALFCDLKPYPAEDGDPVGQDIVRKLGSIAGPNKHEAALTARAAGSIIGMSLRWNADWRIPFPEKMWDSAKNELTLGYFPVGTTGEYDVELRFFVAFDDVEGLEREAARKVLAYWGEYTEAVVQRLEARVTKADAV